MNSITIQKAQAEDYDELRRIYFESRRENFHWMDLDSINIEDFDSSTDGELIYLAKINHEVAGFISIWVEDQFVHNLFVSSNYKRCGVGKALIQEAVNAVGLPLTLKCVKANANALDFYLPQGWSIVEEVADKDPYYFMKYEGTPV